MPLPVWCLVLAGLLVAQGAGKDCHKKKAATLLPSFTATPAASTSRPTTSHRPTTTSHRNVTVHPTSNSTTSSRATTHNPAITTTHGNTTVHPITNCTAAIPTTGFHPVPPPPPPPPPKPGSKEALGNYTWNNRSHPCVQLQAQIQIRILYPTQGGGKAWGISVLNPNKTKVLGDCEGASPHLPLFFPYGQLTFGFKRDPQQSQGAVYLSYMAVEYNVSFPRAAQWAFSAQNSSLRALQAPLGQSFCCRNTSIAVSPTVHLDLLSLRMQAAQLPDSGRFGPCFSCTSDQSLLLPLIIGLVLLGLLTLVLIAFCITRRRQSTYQPL